MTTGLAFLFPYAETTGDITVRVSVSYLADQSEPARERWFWSYHIRIENDGDLPVRLLTRHWIIRDGHGVTQEVRGQGVVGETPAIQPGGAYDYVSGCPLTTASGTMEGSFGLVSGDGERITAAIPLFPLSLV